MGCRHTARRLLLPAAAVLVVLAGACAAGYYRYMHPAESGQCRRAAAEIAGLNVAGEVDLPDIQAVIDGPVVPVNQENLAQVTAIYTSRDDSGLASFDTIDAYLSRRDYAQTAYDIEPPRGRTLATVNPYTQHIIVVVNQSAVKIHGWPPAVRVCTYDGEQVTSFRMPGSPFSVISAVEDVVIGPGGRKVAFATGDSVYLMDMNSYQMERVVRYRVGAMDFSGTGDLLVVATDPRVSEAAMPRLVIWDLSSEEPVEVYQARARFDAVRFVDGDRYILARDDTGTIMVFGVQAD